MGSRVSIIFPYIGDDKDVHKRLLDIIQIVADKNKGLHTSNQPPLLIVDKVTIDKKIFAKFKNFVKQEKKTNLLKKLSIIEVWAVDTCQMWLYGYGKILDDKINKTLKDNTTSILQIPGDLKYINNFQSFVNKLLLMKSMVDKKYDFVLGDFDLEPYKSKQLIDLYGTYPFLNNWFPDIAKEIRESKHLKIKRPRSEFLAVKIPFLKHMILKKRKFAYEQTITFLINALYENKNNKKKSIPWRIGKVDLGLVSDYEEKRGFREATDQIERMARMLRLLWREMNGRDNFDVREFDILEKRSTSIRETAFLSFENILR